jgi:hypothetical protein
MDGGDSKMRHLAILLIAFMLVATACSKQQANPAPSQPGSPPSGTQTPAPAPNGSNPPASTTDPAKPNTATPAPAPAPVEAPKGAKDTPLVSKKQFDSVDFGMTFDQVSQAMGQMGKLTSETKDEIGNTTQTYQYKKSEGGNVNVTFRNGKVINKSESSS